MAVDTIREINVQKKETKTLKETKITQIGRGRGKKTKLDPG